MSCTRMATPATARLRQVVHAACWVAGTTPQQLQCDQGPLEDHAAALVVAAGRDVGVSDQDLLDGLPVHLHQLDALELAAGPAMLRHVLAIVKPTRYARRRVEVRDVIAAACRMLSVEPTVLLSGVRTRSVADARGLVVAAARRLTGRSLAAIARDLCMDDNTALKAGRRGETDPLLPDLLAELMSKRNVPHFGERGPRP